jgi:DNA polymerase-3 subunit alpha
VVDEVRARLIEELREAMQSAEQVARDSAAGAMDMFGGVTELTAPAAQRRRVKPLEPEQRLTLEKETLGLYLSGHPIEPYLGELRRFCTAIVDLTPSAATRIAGLVVGMRTMRGRRGDIAFVTLDDRSGRLEAAVFADVLESVRDRLVKDTLVVVEGEVQPDEFTGGNKLRVEQVYTVGDARTRFARSLDIDLCQARAGGDLTGRLKRLLEPHRNSSRGCRVALTMRLGPAEGRVLLGPEWRVQADDDLLRALRGEFGQEQVGLSYAD